MSGTSRKILARIMALYPLVRGGSTVLDQSSLGEATSGSTRGGRGGVPGHNSGTQTSEASKSRSRQPETVVVRRQARVGGEMKAGGCFALVAYCGAGRPAGDEPTRKFEFRLCYLAKRQPVRFSASFYFSLPRRRFAGCTALCSRVFRLVPNNLACECVYLSTRCTLYRFNLSAAWNCEEEDVMRLRHMIPAAAAV